MAALRPRWKLHDALNDVYEDSVYLAEEELPTAYCAPGRKRLSAWTLALRGERYRELVEHPWLEGTTDIILIQFSPLKIWQSK